MAEEKAFPIIRRVYESTCFDPERGTYRCVIIKVEYPQGNYHDITVPADEFDPDKVPEYVKNWLTKYGKWVGKKIE